MDETDSAAVIGGSLDNLLEVQLKPVIRGIIRRKLHLTPGTARYDLDAEDLVGETIVKLIERLQALRDDKAPANGQTVNLPTPGPAVKGISNLPGYAATVAYSVCEEFLRRKYPERRRLKNRVQYLLTHREEFGLWEIEDGESYGGFKAWRNRSGAAGTGIGIHNLEQHPEEFELAELGGRPARLERPEELVAGIFRWVGAPVEIDALVNLLGKLWEIHEREVRVETDEDALDRRAAPEIRKPDVSDSFDRRTVLSDLWSEICELPLHQRCAVLLNLRDEAGCSAVELFPLLGVATIRQIAESLELPAEEFAGLWNELPLDDARIAARLGVARQQVINLRKSARERLGRRVRDR